MSSMLASQHFQIGIKVSINLTQINDKVFPTFSSCQDAYDNGGAGVNIYWIFVEDLSKIYQRYIRILYLWNRK